MGSREQRMKWYRPSLEHTARDSCGVARLLLLVPSSHNVVVCVTQNSKPFFRAVEEVFLGSLGWSWLLRDEQGFAAWKPDGDYSGKGNDMGQGTGPLSLQEERMPLLICPRAQEKPSHVGSQIRSAGKYPARFLILHWLSYPVRLPFPSVLSGMVSCRLWLRFCGFNPGIVSLDKCFPTVVEGVMCPFNEVHREGKQSNCPFKALFVYQHYLVDLFLLCIF